MHFSFKSRWSSNGKYFARIGVDSISVYETPVSYALIPIPKMSPIMRKSMSKLVMQPSFRAVGQKAAEWQTFEKQENKRQMYSSGSCSFSRMGSFVCFMKINLCWLVAAIFRIGLCLCCDELLIWFSQSDWVCYKGGHEGCTEEAWWNWTEWPAHQA